MRLFILIFSVFVIFDGVSSYNVCRASNDFAWPPGDTKGPPMPFASGQPICPDGEFCDDGSFGLSGSMDSNEFRTKPMSRILPPPFDPPSHPLFDSSSSDDEYDSFRGDLRTDRDQNGPTPISSKNGWTFYSSSPGGGRPPPPRSIYGRFPYVPRKPRSFGYWPARGRRAVRYEHPEQFKHPEQLKHSELFNSDSQRIQALNALLQRTENKEENYKALKKVVQKAFDIYFDDTVLHHRLSKTVDDKEHTDERKEIEKEIKKVEERAKELPKEFKEYLEKHGKKIQRKKHHHKNHQ